MRIDRLKALVFMSFVLYISTAASQPIAGRTQGNDSYQVIIKNNLFRPLGWYPKPQKTSYQLLGTVIGPGDQAKALIKIGDKTVYVKVGEQIEGAVLKEVHEKRAVLEKEGKLIELRIEQLGFLGTSRGRRGGGGSLKGERTKSERVSGRIEKTKGLSGKRIERIRGRIPQAILDRIPPGIRKKFMNASPQERREMIRNFIRRRLGGGRRRGR